MKTNQNLRRLGEKKGSKQVTLNLTGVRLALQGFQRMLWSLGNGGAWKMLKRVQHDKLMRGRCGFTLIELLVVVLIIGILASVALPQYQKAVRKARLAEVATVYNTVTRGIDMWLVENGFPSSGGVWFSGTNKKDVELDISPAWTSEADNNSFTNTGRWHLTCSDICYISFFPGGWLDNNLFWMKESNADWKLYSFESNSDSSVPELCRWWNGLYGTEHMTADVVTVCTPYL